MRFVVVVVVLVVTALAAAWQARAAERVTLPAAASVSFPFGCDWGYDWDLRCFRLRGDRILLGGAGDKIWRGGVRFDLRGVPPGTRVTAAEAWLWFDGSCFDARDRVDACPVQTFDIVAHALWGDWFREREPDFDEDPVAVGTLEAGEGAQWVALDLAPLVTDWLGGLRNDGVLLQLDGTQEPRDGGGPRLASSDEPRPELRPRLEVSFVPG